MSEFIGWKVPSVSLPATTGQPVDLSKLAGDVLVFVVPGPSDPTDPPDADWMEGWKALPGAAGCTGQCSLVDRSLPVHGGVRAFIVSRQATEVQARVARARGWSLPLLSDEAGMLETALGLERFEYRGHAYLARTTFVLKDGVIIAVIPSSAPPNEHLSSALAVLE